MKIIAVSYKEAAAGNAVFIAAFQSASLERDALVLSLSADTRKTLLRFAREEFHGEDGEIKTLWLADRKPSRLVLFGLGEQKKWHTRKMPLIARRMVRFAKNQKIREFATPLINDAKQFTENALMAQFEYNIYKETPKDGWPEVKKIVLAVADKNISSTTRGIAEGIIMGEEINATRMLANTPGSDMTPTHLADAARLVAKKTGITAKILDKKEMTRMGMGGVLGVAKGSGEEPKFIILEYHKGPKTQKPLVLIGKGVTFDSGGINLKPEQYMYEMHMDMSGGAAVIHGIAAIARLKLPINVIGLVPAVENMPSGSSYRPGDLLKSMSGKTIEVLNTDAEGRVILADALTYALRYKPGLIADFATLTGAAHVALGNYCSALFTNRDALIEKLTGIGTTSGDYVWPLPLWDEYLPEIKGIFGDIANMAKNDRYGGAIHGAKFLEQFVADTPWAHLDIAPRMTSVESDYLAKGASGVGVRYIVELAREYPKLKYPLPSD
ncbi:MAG: leucyl aminopeptidase [Candidatus Sungiibacteriota bacterium]